MKPLDAWNIDRIPDIVWVVLKNDVRNTLSEQIEFKFDSNNLKPNMSLHHATLFFKPKYNEIDIINAWAKNNDYIDIEIIENCWNDKIQALHVRLFNTSGKELYIPNKIFHITVSADKNVAPKESNNMLLGQHNSEPLNIKVKGVFEFHNY